MKTLATVTIAPAKIELNGRLISTAQFAQLYKEFLGDYHKYHKMDCLCKLGIIGAELLLKDVGAAVKENAAVILFNRNGPLLTDRKYQQTITDDNYYPGPALFVYTLANIVTGEIAIRHKIQGETAFYILDRFDTDIIDKTVEETFQTSTPSLILSGWVDYDDDGHYLADLKLTTK